MSETINVQQQAKPFSGGDRQIMAQVEKWIAVIREISREQAKN